MRQLVDAPTQAARSECGAIVAPADAVHHRRRSARVLPVAAEVDIEPRLVVLISRKTPALAVVVPKVVAVRPPPRLGLGALGGFGLGVGMEGR